MMGTSMVLFTAFYGRSLFTGYALALVANLEKILMFASAISANNLFAQKGIGLFLRAGIVFILGLIHLFFPEQMWNWESRHLFKDKQPTPSSLLVYRSLGGIAIVISIIILIKG